jgi:uncharacterized damage-inducible protein DinB
MNERERKVLDLPSGYAPEIGVLLWMLEDGRALLKEGLAGLDAAHEHAILNWTPGLGVNSIGTLLYHIAAVETDWLFEEALAGYTPPAAVAWPDALLPHNMRNAQGELTPVLDESLADHLRRLDAIRVLLLDAFKGMSIAEFRRPRRLEWYDVTPEWVLHHLIQHEAEHRGQILERRAEAERVIDQ